MITNPRLAERLAERQRNAVHVFLHIPRTGGTSLTRAIANALAPGEYLDLSGPTRTAESIAEEIRALTPEQVAKLRFVAGDQAWYGVHELLGRSAKYITFLRTPVARVFSNYRVMRRELSHPFNAAIRKHALTFSKYVSSPNHPMVANHMAVLLERRRAGANLSADDCWRVNSGWLERADVNLANFWFVGFQESFDADFRLLCARMGLTCEPRRDQRSADAQPDDVEISAADAARCAALNWADAALYELAQIRRGLGMCLGATA